MEERLLLLDAASDTQSSDGLIMLGPRTPGLQAAREHEGGLLYQPHSDTAFDTDKNGTLPNSRYVSALLEGRCGRSSLVEPLSLEQYCCQAYLATTLEPEN